MPREVTIVLSDELAEDADRYGVLQAENLRLLIRDEVRRKAMDEEPMSEDEIQAEIDAYRAERREKLRAEIRRQAWIRLSEAMDRMDADGTVPPMTSEEIEAELEAARAERRALRAGGA